MQKESAHICSWHYTAFVPSNRAAGKEAGAATKRPDAILGDLGEPW